MKEKNESIEKKCRQNAVYLKVVDGNVVGVKNVCKCSDKRK